MFGFVEKKSKNIQTGDGYIVKYEDKHIRIIKVQDWALSYKTYSDLTEHLDAGYKIISQSESTSWGDKFITYTLQKPNDTTDKEFQ